MTDNGAPINVEEIDMNKDVDINEEAMERLSTLDPQDAPLHPEDKFSLDQITFNNNGSTQEK